MIRGALAAGLLVAIATTPVHAAKPEFARPPFAGAYQPQGSDERGLWMEFDEEERILRDSAYVVRDPALTQFVQRALCRAVGEDRCQAVRVYVVQNEIFNANMAPNGLMRVHTGLL